MATAVASKKTAGPRARTGHSAVIYGKRMYVFGGRSTRARRGSAEELLPDLGDEGDEASPDSQSAGDEESSMGALESTIHFSNDLYSFDFKSCKWRVEKPKESGGYIPEQRSGCPPFFFSSALLCSPPPVDVHVECCLLCVIPTPPCEVQNFSCMMNWESLVSVIIVQYPRLLTCQSLLICRIPAVIFRCIALHKGCTKRPGHPPLYFGPGGIGGALMGGGLEGVE